jgi:hypothetical protein
LPVSSLFLSDGEVAVFEGGFGKTWWQSVVFLWSVCGGMRGKRWFVDGVFFALKNMPQCPTLFSISCWDVRSGAPGMAICL